MAQSEHENQQVTLTLPTRLAQSLQEQAEVENQTVSFLVMQRLGALPPSTPERYQAAMERSIAAMRRGLGLGTGGKMPCTRDEAHERG